VKKYPNMTHAQALREVRSALEDSGMYGHDVVKWAMTLLENAPQPIGYIEPGRAYVVQVKEFSEHVAEILTHAIGVFKDLDCKVIILGPEMELIQPPTRLHKEAPNSVNPCDDCKTRFECTGVCERLANALNHDPGHHGDKTPQGDVIVEDDDELD